MKAIATRTVAILLTIIVVIAVLGVLAYLATRPPEVTPKPPVRIVFASTQLSPPAEQSFMVSLLSEFYKETGIDVSFIPYGYTDIANKLEAEIKAGRVTMSIVGGLATEIDYFASKGFLEDLGKFGALTGRTFVEAALKAVGDQKSVYGITTFVPWMTATFVIVINNEAFNYLPQGLTADDVVKGTNKWTWDALLAWAKNIYEKVGERRVGLPAGAGGLLHRLLHGYLYVSYTGYQAKNFNSPEAVEMWTLLRELWKYCHPESTTWSAMADPLLRGDVWIAWDHTARIMSAVREKPNTFTVAPVPRGPAGRGYIVVLAGLAIPKNAPNQEEAWKLIEYLSRPQVQAKIAENVGFFPVVTEATPAITDPGVKKISEGVATQLGTVDRIVVFIPPLGGKAGDFVAIYRGAFERIVLKGEDISVVISELEPGLKAIFAELKIPEP